MNPETAIEIGEFIGEVVMTQDDSEMREGTFMQVRVLVDISCPLCRGRKVNFEDDLDGWVSFQYERLLNLYFWCGMLLHDDKKCEIQLKSNGNLPLEQQQYGHQIKALIFNLAKRQVLKVKGFDLATVRASVDQSIWGGSSMSLGNNKLPSLLPLPSVPHRSQIEPIGELLLSPSPSSSSSSSSSSSASFLFSFSLLSHPDAFVFQSSSF